MKSDLSAMARLVAGAKFVMTGQASEQWFGPGAPLQSVAPETVRGRMFDFPFAINVNSNKPRASETIGFAELRALADNYDLLRLVIETRKDQMSKMKWTIKPRGAGKTDDARCRQASDFFQFPDREHSWEDWLRMILEDLLVTDAPAIYPRKTRGGALYALEPMDGTTIKRVLDGAGRTPQPPEPAYQQMLKGMPAVDYTRDELIYRPRNPRTHKVYGFSPVEQVVMTVNIALRRQLHQLEYYRSGSVPDALAGVPADWQPDQIKQFQDYWDLLMEGDSAAQRRLKFVPGELAKNFKETKQPPLKDVYDEWLARVVCFAFSIEPTPFVAQVNRATAETAREQSLAEGLAPLQSWVKVLVDGVLAKHMGMADLHFCWDDEEAIDPMTQAQINVLYVNAGVLLANEVREGLGLEAIEQPEPQTAAEVKDEPKAAEEKTAAKHGGMLRKQSPKAQRHPSARALAAARKALAKHIEAFFPAAAADLAAQLAKRLGLAKADRADDALDDVDWGAWDALATGAVAHLAVAAEFGARDALARLRVIDAADAGQWIDSIDTYQLAINLAQQRAAEMVGRKWAQGHLVPNPNATWQITQGTRDMIRSLVETAIAEGWSSDTLADAMLGHRAFGSARARTIARTEVRISQMQGQLAGAQAAGATHKAWSTSLDDKVSDECVACEQEGELEVGSAFGSGQHAPPNHPNCRCVLTFKLADDWTQNDAA